MSELEPGILEYLRLVCLAVVLPPWLYIVARFISKAVVLSIKETQTDEYSKGDEEKDSEAR